MYGLQICAPLAQTRGCRQLNAGSMEDVDVWHPFRLHRSTGIDTSQIFHRRQNSCISQLCEYGHHAGPTADL